MLFDSYRILLLIAKYAFILTPAIILLLFPENKSGIRIFGETNAPISHNCYTRCRTMKKQYNKKRPDNLSEMLNWCNDKTDYTERLKGIESLSKYLCYESKKKLYELMIHDGIHTVKEQAFRALQNFGEDVRLPKKKKGKLIKDIREKLIKVHNNFNSSNYSIIDFRIKFQEMYPEAYDIYQYEKKGKFDEFILNTVKMAPKKKMKYEYEVTILFDNTSASIDISKNIEYKNSNGRFDLLVIKDSLIKINCDRSANIELENIIINEQNTIHGQIIKSLVYYYLLIGEFTPILEINLKRIKNGNEISKKIPNHTIDINQVLNNNFSLNNRFTEAELEDIFHIDSKSVALLNALTFLLKATITTEPNDKFERLWKSFNAIYSYFGNGASETECHRTIKQFIVLNKSNFQNTIDRINSATVSDLRLKIRFRDLILNDYPTKNHTVSYIAFLYRYDNWKLNQLFKETLPYREEYLKDIKTISDVEKKFNKFDGIKHLYQSNKTNPDSNAIYNQVVTHLDHNIANKSLNNDIDVVTFICIKYAYYLRNKIFHAEKQDLTFRFAGNNFITDLDWINNILENLLIELIKINKTWIQATI